MGNGIRPSHNIVYSRGVVYCNHCGYYSKGKRMDNFASGCGMTVLPSQVRFRDMLREGTCPSQLKAWPRPDEPQAPDELKPWVVTDWGEVPSDCNANV